MNFSVIHKRIKDKFNKEEHIHCLVIFTIGEFDCDSEK